MYLDTQAPPGKGNTSLPSGLPDLEDDDGIPKNPENRSVAPSIADQPDLHGYFDPADVRLAHLEQWGVAKVEGGNIVPVNDPGVLPTPSAHCMAACTEWLKGDITFARIFRGLGEVKITVSMQEILDFLATLELPADQDVQHSVKAAKFRLVGSGVLWFLGADYLDACLEHLGLDNEQKARILTPELRQWFRERPNDLDVRLWFPGASQNQLEYAAAQLELFLGQRLPKRYHNIRVDDQALQDYLKAKIKGYKPQSGECPHIKRWLTRMVCFDGPPLVDARKRGTLLCRVGLSSEKSTRADGQPTMATELLLTSSLLLESIQHGRWQLPLLDGDHTPITEQAGDSGWTYLLNFLCGNFVVRDPSAHNHDAEAYLRGCLGIVKGKRSLAAQDTALVEIALKCLPKPIAVHLGRELSRVVGKHATGGIDGAIATLVAAGQMGRQVLDDRAAQGLWSVDAPLLQAKSEAKKRVAKGSAKTMPLARHPITQTIQRALVLDGVPTRAAMDALGSFGLIALLTCPEGRLNAHTRVVLVEHNGKQHLKFALTAHKGTHQLLLPIDEKAWVLAIGDLCTFSLGHHYLHDLSRMLLDASTSPVLAPKAVVEHLKRTSAVNTMLTQAVYALLANEDPTIQLTGLHLFFAAYAIEPDPKLLRAAIQALPWVLKALHTRDEISRVVHLFESVLRDSPYAHLLGASGELSALREQLPRFRKCDDDNGMLAEWVGLVAGSPDAHLRRVALDMWKVYIQQPKRYGHNPTGTLIGQFLSCGHYSLASEVLQEAHTRQGLPAKICASKLLTLCKRLSENEDSFEHEASMQRICALAAPLAGDLTSCAIRGKGEEASLFLLVRKLLSRGEADVGRVLLSSYTSRGVRTSNRNAFVQVQLQLCRNYIEQGAIANALEVIATIRKSNPDVKKLGASETLQGMCLALLGLLEKQADAIDSSTLETCLDTIRDFAELNADFIPRVIPLVERLVTHHLSDKQPDSAYSQLKEWQRILPMGALTNLLPQISEGCAASGSIKYARSSFFDSIEAFGDDQPMAFALFEAIVNRYIADASVGAAMRFIQHKSVQGVVDNNRSSLLSMVMTCLEVSEGNSGSTAAWSDACTVALDLFVAGAGNRECAATIAKSLTRMLAQGMGSDSNKSIDFVRIFGAERSRVVSFLSYLEGMGAIDTKWALLVSLADRGLLPARHHGKSLVHALQRQVTALTESPQMQQVGEADRVLSAVFQSPEMLAEFAEDYLQLNLRVAHMWMQLGEDLNALACLKCISPHEGVVSVAPSFDELCLSVVESLTDKGLVRAAVDALECVSTPDAYVSQSEKILVSAMKQCTKVQDWKSAIEILARDIVKDKIRQSEAVRVAVADFLKSILESDASSAALEDVIAILTCSPELAFSCWPQVTTAASVYSKDKLISTTLVKAALKLAHESPMYADFFIEGVWSNFEYLAVNPTEYGVQLLQRYRSTGSLPPCSSDVQAQLAGMLVMIGAHNTARCGNTHKRSTLLSAVCEAHESHGILYENDACRPLSQAVNLKLFEALTAVGDAGSTQVALMTLSAVLKNWGGNSPSDALPRAVARAFRAVNTTCRRDLPSALELLEAVVSKLLQVPSGSINYLQCVDAILECAPLLPEVLSLANRLIPSMTSNLNETSSELFVSVVSRLIREKSGTCRKCVQTLLESVEVQEGIDREVWCKLVDMNITLSFQDARTRENVAQVADLIKLVPQLIATHFSGSVMNRSSVNEAIVNIPWLMEASQALPKAIYDAYCKPIYAALSKEHCQNPDDPDLGSHADKDLSLLLLLMADTLSRTWTDRNALIFIRGKCVEWLECLHKNNYQPTEKLVKVLKTTVFALVSNLRFMPRPQKEAEDFAQCNSITSKWGQRLFFEDPSALLTLQYIGQTELPKCSNGTQKLHAKALDELVNKALSAKTPWGLRAAIGITQTCIPTVLQAEEKLWIVYFKRFLDACKERPYYMTEGVYLFQFLAPYIEKMVGQFSKIKHHSGNHAALIHFARQRCTELLDAIVTTGESTLATESSITPLNAQMFEGGLLAVLVSGMHVFKRCVELMAFKGKYSPWFEKLKRLAPVYAACNARRSLPNDSSSFFIPLDALAASTTQKNQYRNDILDVLVKWISELVKRDSNQNCWSATQIINRCYGKQSACPKTLERLRDKYNISARAREHVVSYVGKGVSESAVAMSLVLLGSHSVMLQLLQRLGDLMAVGQCAIEAGIFIGEPEAAIEMLESLIPLAANMMPSGEQTFVSIKIFQCLESISKDPKELNSEQMQRLGDAVLKWVKAVHEVDTQGRYLEHLKNLVQTASKRDWLPDPTKVSPVLELLQEKVAITD